MRRFNCCDRERVRRSKAAGVVSRCNQQAQSASPISKPNQQALMKSVHRREHELACLWFSIFCVLASFAPRHFPFVFRYLFSVSECPPELTLAFFCRTQQAYTASVYSKRLQQAYTASVYSKRSRQAFTAGIISSHNQQPNTEWTCVMCALHCSHATRRRCGCGFVRLLLRG